MNGIIHYVKRRKCLFHRKKICEFEHIGNSMHSTEFLSLRKALNIYIDYLMFYASRQYMK